MMRHTKRVKGNGVSRYELRRYHDTEKDHTFQPAYADLDWAREVARDYSAPGTTIEIWDTETAQPVARITNDDPTE